MQLSQLAASLHSPVDFIGLVKETGVDDTGLNEFYQRYYNFPLFKDTGLETYKAFGNRSIFRFRTWNPFRLYRGFQDLKKRIQSKQVEGNYAGEGLIQGGVLVFDAQGVLRFAFEEQIGQELDLVEIRSAVSSVVAGDARMSESENNEETVPSQHSSEL
jgi:hypothetical protein